jgi:hypothetical protein
MGLVLFRQGYHEKAKSYLVRASEQEPDSVEALNSLAWVCATSSLAHLRDGKKAVEYATRAVSLAGIKPDESCLQNLDTLAAAYARNGQFDKAAETQQEAPDPLKTTPGLSEGKIQDLSVHFGQRLRLYEDKMAFTDESQERVN